MNMRQFYRKFEQAIKRLSLKRELICYSIRLRDEFGDMYCPITAVFANEEGRYTQTRNACVVGKKTLHLPENKIEMIIDVSDCGFKKMTPAEKRCHAALLRRIK
jgi:hypothetical protein